MLLIKNAWAWVVLAVLSAWAFLTFKAHRAAKRADESTAALREHQLAAAISSAEQEERKKHDETINKITSTDHTGVDRLVQRDQARSNTRATTSSTGAIKP